MEDREVLYKLWLFIKDLPEDPELCMKAVKVQKMVLRDTGAWERCQEIFDQKEASLKNSAK